MKTPDECIRRRSRAIVCLVIGFAAHLGTWTAHAGEPSVRVVGIEVVWDDSDEVFGKGLGVFNPWAPVRLVMEVDTGGKKILGMTWSENKVTFLRDNTGKDLKGKNWFWQLASTAKSQAGPRFEILGNMAPAEGASTIRVKGVAMLRTASQKETKQSPLLPVKVGQRVKIAEDLEFRLTKSGDSKTGHQLMVEFLVEREIPEVTAFCFLDENGMELRIAGSSTGSGRLPGNRTCVVKQFHFDRKVEKFQMEVERWTDLKLTEVPFDITIPLGGVK